MFKHFFASITITILCGSTTLGAYNDEYKYFIGRKFWVIDASSVTFYENCTLIPLIGLHIKQGTSFVVKGVKEDELSKNPYASYGPELKVVLDTGQEACFNAARMVPEYKQTWYTDKDITIEIGESIRKLDASGIVKGASVWHKYNGLKPGLTKQIIEAVNVSVINKKIIITLDSKEMEFKTIDEVKDDYYIGDLPKHIKKWSKKTLSAIAEGSVFIGMTRDQVFTSLGRPFSNNKSTGKWGLHEQLVYGSSYVYLENGKVTSFQH
ncbi:MAG: hypothetical protein WCK54_09970 [Desulfuromonadales bacterium]